MTRHLVFSLVVLFCPLIIVAQGLSEARTALVIGVSSYRDRYFNRLEAPEADAQAIAVKLKELGFDVTLKLNASRREMFDATDSFGEVLTKRQGVGLFYFSGHGSMKPDEADPNFLIPAGTAISSREDLPQEAFNAQRVANRMKEAGNRLNLIFLDSCRDNSLPSRNKNADGGLAAMRGASGLMFFFATQPNQIAVEDSQNKRSLFTMALLRHMGTPGLSFMDMMADVTSETEKLSVEDGSTFKQSPFMTGTLSGRFSFSPGALNPSPPAPLTSTTAPKVAPTKATKADPFVNSLGMKFVPVSGTNVLFCQHETRKLDYSVYAHANAGVDDSWKFVEVQAVHVSSGDDHPAVKVSWADAVAFCDWLSRKEGLKYRLPTDHEWSVAVGIGSRENADELPSQKDEKVYNEYPWGRGMSPRNANLADWTTKQRISNWAAMDGYSDGYATTAPVMSFEPNSLGLYDLGGNVWEWCNDWYDETRTRRVLRGGSWTSNGGNSLLSSARNDDLPVSRQHNCGFRCVLVVSER